MRDLANIQSCLGFQDTSPALNSNPVVSQDSCGEICEPGENSKVGLVRWNLTNKGFLRETIENTQTIHDSMYCEYIFNLSTDSFSMKITKTYSETTW